MYLARIFMCVNISEKKEIHSEKIRIRKHYERLPDKAKKSRRISKEAHFLSGWNPSQHNCSVNIIANKRRNWKNISAESECVAVIEKQSIELARFLLPSCCCWDIDSLHMPSHMRCLTWRFAPFTLTSVHKSVGLMDRELSRSKSGGFRSSTIEAKQKCCKISNFKTVTNGTCIVVVMCVLYVF